MWPVSERITDTERVVIRQLRRDGIRSHTFRPNVSRPFEAGQTEVLIPA